MLLGILLQTTQDVAGMVVRPFAEEGDGVGAWRALISRYGNDSVELRQGSTDRVSEDTGRCLLQQ